MLEETLAKLLSRVTEFSVATGDATDGSTTELEDTNAVWEVNKWKDAVVEITQSFQVLTLAPAPAGYMNCVISDIGKMVQDDGVNAGLLLSYNNILRVWLIRTTTTIVGGSVMTIPTGTGAGIAAISVTSSTHYYVTITSNDANTLTFPAIAVAVVAGDHYEIRMTLRLADIDKWGGTAQTGLDIGAELPKKVNKAITPVIYNKTMTLADTQYSQELPANTKKYTIQTRDGTAFRIAFETGKVAAPTEPYFSIDTDGFHHEDLIEPASLTLYFACGSAGKVAEIIAWS